MRPKGPIKYNGPTWPQVRRQIKPKFTSAGINYCELSWEKCEWPKTKTFAHSLRHRFIATKEQMEEVILTCQKCHAQLDANPLEVTYDIVREVINNRRNQVRSIYAKTSRR